MRINNIRIIPYEVHTGRQNMAIDHFFAEMQPSVSSAVFRFYGWKPCCISLGHHQDFSVINQNFYNSHKNIDIVKRPTGGSAVFHCDELTYSLIISKNVSNHQVIYSLIHKIIAEALNDLDYHVYLEDAVKGERTEICYNRAAKSEIKYKGKKLVGSAQRIYQNNILQHGSILFSNRQHVILDYLSYDKEEIERHKIELSENSTALNDINAKTLDKPLLINKLTERITQYFTGFVYYQYLTGREKTIIKNLENIFSVE